MQVTERRSAAPYRHARMQENYGGRLRGIVVPCDTRWRSQWKFPGILKIDVFWEILDPFQRVLRLKNTRVLLHVFGRSKHHSFIHWRSSGANKAASPEPSVNPLRWVNPATKLPVIWGGACCLIYDLQEGSAEVETDSQ